MGSCFRASVLADWAGLDWSIICVRITRVNNDVGKRALISQTWLVTYYFLALHWASFLEP